MLFVIDDEIEILILKVASFCRHKADFFFSCTISSFNYPIIYRMEFCLCRISFGSDFFSSAFIYIEQCSFYFRFFSRVPNQKSNREFSSDIIKSAAEAHKALSEQFEKREVHKTYHCLVNGRPVWKEFHADYPLQVDGDKRHRTIVAKGGKPSVTDFRFIGACGPFSWLEACPKTGRTHQIRAHLREMKLTIVADPLYSGNQRGVYLSDFKRKWNGNEDEERPLLSRLALHAYSIEFRHPASGEMVSFTAPYPRDLEAVRKQMAKVFKVDPITAGERPL